MKAGTDRNAHAWRLTMMPTAQVPLLRYEEVPNFFLSSSDLWSSGYGVCLSFCTSVVRVRVVSFSSALYVRVLQFSVVRQYGVDS